MIACNFMVQTYVKMWKTERMDVFDQCVTQRHFLSKSDINNIRVKVGDCIIKQHEDDAASVSLLVSELHR